MNDNSQTRDYLFLGQDLDVSAGQITIQELLSFLEAKRLSFDKFAKALDFSSGSAVSYWKEKGHIPKQAQSKILQHFQDIGFERDPVAYPNKQYEVLLNLAVDYVFNVRLKSGEIGEKPRNMTLYSDVLKEAKPYYDRLTELQGDKRLWDFLLFALPIFHERFYGSNEDQNQD